MTNKVKLRPNYNISSGTKVAKEAAPIKQPSTSTYFITRSRIAQNNDLGIYLALQQYIASPTKKHRDR